MKKLATLCTSLCLIVALVCVLSACGASQEAPRETPAEDSELATTSTGVPSEPYTEVVSSSAYAYEELSDKEQTMYKKMKNALLNHSPAIEDGLDGFTHEQLSKISLAVMTDSPEIFWADGSGTTYTSELNGVKTVTKYEFNYTLDKNQRSTMQSKIDTVVDSFLSGIDPEMSEYEKVLAVYEYIIETTDYNMEAKEKTDRGASDAETEACQTISSVFVDNKTVCAGYSKATQYLLNKLDIFCTFVSGTARGQGSHAWNLVKIEGDYYLLDTTWGNPISMDPAREKRMTYDYFCLTTAEFAKTHTPNADISLPNCTATKYNYFVYNDLLLRSYDTVRIEEIIAETATAGAKGISIKFIDENTADEAYTALFGDAKEIFSILKSVASANASVDATRVMNSFDEDNGIIYIELSYQNGTL